MAQERLRERAYESRSILLLIFCKTYNPPLTSLSLNIIREISEYLSHSYYIASLYESSVYCYFRNPAECIELTLPSKIPGSRSYCFIGNTRLLVVAGPNSSRDIRAVDLLTLTITPKNPLVVGRSWPGVYHYADYVYIFGGHSTSNTVNTSSEKYSLKSELCVEIGSMKYPRSCFTPCLWKEEIYLPAIDSGDKPVEVFTPRTEVFRVTPLVLNDRVFGAVSYVVDGELIVLLYGKTLGKWRVGSQDTSLTFIHHKLINPENALCNHSVLRMDEELWWSNCRGKLVKLRLSDYHLFEIPEAGS